MRRWFAALAGSLMVAGTAFAATVPQSFTPTFQATRSLAIIGDARRVSAYDPSQLVLDFVNGYYQDGLGHVAVGDPRNLPTATFTRASTGVATTASYLHTEFASGVPRITNQGYLSELATTNSIRNPRAEGATPGTPGTPPTNWSVSAPGLSSQIVGSGTDATTGIQYVDIRLFGTAGVNSSYLYLEAATQIAATTAQTWTPSAYVALVGGSTANVTTAVVLVEERNASGTGLADNPGANFLGSLTGAPSRFFASLTTAQATIAFVQPGLRLTFTNGGAVDLTLRIGWPNAALQGNVSSAVLPPAGAPASATRAADTFALASMPALAGVTLVDYTPNAVTSANQWIYQPDDGTGNNRESLFINGSGLMLLTTLTGGVAQGNINLGTAVAGTRYRVAIRNTGGTVSASINGGAVGSITPANGYPVGVNARHLANSNSGVGQGMLYLSRVIEYPTAAPTDAQLQAMSALP